MVKRDVATKQNRESAFEIAHCGEDNEEEEELRGGRKEGRKQEEVGKVGGREEEEVIWFEPFKKFSFIFFVLYCTLYHIYDKAVCLSHFSR